MSLQQIQAESLRRAMLKLLASQPDYSATDYDLQRGVEIKEGVRVSFDTFKAEQKWIEEQGLITVKGEVVETLTLTQRGLDVSEYRTDMPGVAKKRPGM